MMKYDVIALGEILIDFTYVGKNSDGKNLFEQNAGGAVANCAVQVAKLGGISSFIGMVGADSFGSDLRETLNANGVDTTFLYTTRDQHTTLAFVHVDERGERHFSFCRNPGADTQISVQHINEEAIAQSKILQIGSLSLIFEPSLSATKKAIDLAKKHNTLVSYDPNWREPLWKGRADAHDLIKSIIPACDIVKISDEEGHLLFPDCKTNNEIAGSIIEKGVRLVLITLGADGVFYKFHKGQISFEGQIASPKVDAIDTTGAGDSFTGALLYKLSRREKIFGFSQTELEEDLRFATTVAALCVMKRGAIPALPSNNDVLNFLQNHLASAKSE